MAWEIHSTDTVRIYCGREKPEAVKTAAANLAEDFGRVFGTRAQICEEGRENCAVVIEDKWEPDKDKSGSAAGKKEAFIMEVRNGILCISGADRRGIIYGLYKLSDMLGVSPWYFFADVPVKKKECFALPEGFFLCDYPSVEYRGIFINDEEELDKWARLHMGEETIGVNTYEKIFELLLRLGANYIWPAMHVNSFNMKRENGELAHRMGIVVGTSHCDMLMRSNNREWVPWLKKKGYADAEYDYSVPGRNREILKEYWRESVEQNKEFEVGYTLGMRGIHDSGFETKNLSGLCGEELLQAKIQLLQTVINDQEKILADTLDAEPLKSFVPYKEVLELYDNGLLVPEDLTLIWANDNYGYIRRYPGEKEKKRRGGNGIYYHNSYWAPPGASYLFINSIPLAHTRNELYKAWNEGIRKVWVLNVGAVKPLEQEISFYLRFAWEVGRENALTENVDSYLAHWIDGTFSGGHGKEMAEVLGEFAQLANVRKIELMDSDVFSQTAYGDEASARINRLNGLVRRADKVYEALPDEERDAFFQICLMKLHAAYYTNCMYYYADRSSLCIKQGKSGAAFEYTKLSQAYDDRRRKMLLYYNDVMSGGKWSGIVTPEDFPPPRTAMLPACKVPLTPLEETEKRLVVTVWNDEEELCFIKRRTKWFELACAGEGELEYRVSAPEWLSLSGGKIKRCGGRGADGEYRGTAGAEERILAEVRYEFVREAPEKEAGELEGEIIISCERSGQRIRIPVRADLVLMACAQKNVSGEVCFPLSHVEDGKIITMEADSMRRPENSRAGALAGEEGTIPWGWKRIERLGHDHGSLMEAQGKEAEPLVYDFYVCGEAKEPLLEIFRFPSLNSVGRIRAEVSVDEGGTILVESESTDEWRGNWKNNIFNNVDKLTVKLPAFGAGKHTLKISAVDKYFAFSRLVLYTGARKENMLGASEENAAGGAGLPEYTADFAGMSLGERLYGNIPLAPRPMLVAALDATDDTLPDTDTRVEQTRYGSRITPQELLAGAKSIFAEKDGNIRIDMASALAQTENAYMKNAEAGDGAQWDYCVSDSYGRTGLAILIRRPGLKFSAETVPSLSYRIHCGGGIYRLWLLMKCDSYDTAQIGAAIDGEWLERTQINGGAQIGRYSAERVYRWVPVWKRELTEGMHIVSISTPASGNRFDRIYITKGDEIPPVDSMWRR